ncbi:hypothetical protein [Streptomyces xanthophaeus]|uniref:Uncharacterized protein n=1 Tax=Streptomyces xanthophaeus TaxID=67385 RepID=A0A919H6D9_9ACTN|nr:hypothetical protein [Streptomyces xanthophaeus]GHI88314.1 hypothetical protein Sxan_56780 [Streptomyces xanthophaeus]
MTETITEPQAPPEESTPAPAPPRAETTSSAPGKAVEHTAGGIPVVPLSLSGTNTTAGLLATAALVGGPVAAVVAMTGAAVLATAAVHQRTKNSKAKKPSTRTTPATGRTTGASTGRGRGLLGRIPSQPRTASRTGGGSTGSRKGAGGGRARRRLGGSSASRSSGSAPGRASGVSSPRQRAARAVAGLAGGRAGQVRELRSQARTQSPTRAAARTAGVQARRQVADTRRAKKAADRAAGASGSKPRGAAARTLAKSMGKAAAVRDRATGAARQGRDRSAGRTVAAGRTGVQQAAHRQRVKQLAAPARKAARKALRRSAARFHARRAVAAVLGGLLGAVGLLTTPLGRKLGWAWLQNPGRRFYRRLLASAKEERQQRDLRIAEKHDADMEEVLAQADAERDQDTTGRIRDRVERPARHIPAPPSREGAPSMSSSIGSGSGFRFEDLASEMEQAAQAYEPDGCMEILSMVEGLPEALASVANIMQILAERSDTEFPLEKEVADGFNDIYGALNSATAVAEDLAPLFRKVHEQDIARHEDPRNGPEAEKGWNV